MPKVFDEPLMLEVKTAKEHAVYVESPLRTFFVFLPLLYAWKLLELTPIPALLRRAGKVGPKMSDSQWLVRFPWMWGDPFTVPNGGFKRMSREELRRIHRRNAWFTFEG